tara:strand:- start:1096 stop:1338 length:243 start_codon:yes stop_codon:yes gene_type:complete
MAYEIKDGTGSLFTNKNKKTDKHPDYTGKCKIAGVERNVSGWINTSESGIQYMRLSFDEYEGNKDNSSTYTSTSTEEVPF